MNRPIESDYISQVAYTRALEAYCDELVQPIIKSYLEKDNTEEDLYDLAIKADNGGQPENPPLPKAEEYKQNNPLGGPAKVFDAMAAAIRAGDSYESVLRQFGYQLAQLEQEPVTWRNAAIRVGEDLCSVGPFGYYEMTAEQWLDWAMEQKPQGKNSLAQPEFIKHEVENADDWSEWVCPNPNGYLMKCCDCGLVHEAEFGVVRYKSVTEREDCDMVDDPNLQAVFRMRRSEQWLPVDTAHRAGGMPMEQPAQQEPAGWRPATFHRDNLTFNPGLPDEQTVKFWKLQGVEIEYCYTTPQPAQRTWVGLTDEEAQWLYDNCRTPSSLIDMTEAKLKAKNQ